MLQGTMLHYGKTVKLKEISVAKTHISSYSKCSTMIKISRPYTTPYRTPRHRITSIDNPPRLVEILGGLGRLQYTVAYCVVHNNTSLYTVAHWSSGGSLFDQQPWEEPSFQTVLASKRTQVEAQETIKKVKNQSLLHHPLPSPATQKN